MLKHLLLTTALAASAAGLFAQDDITRHYLVNGNFDEHCNYDATRTTNVAGDVIHDVYGWTNASTTTYTVAGTFEWNGKAKFNSSAAIPTAGYDGKEGGGLAISTGWGQTITYTQSVTLTKGTYRLATAAYNAGTAKAGKLTVSWTPTNGTPVTMELSNVTAKKWAADTLDIILTAKKTGTVSVSFTAANAASGSNAKLVVDYVRLLAKDMDLASPLSSLKSAIAAAKTQQGKATVNADVLQAVIDRAQAIYDAPQHTALQILDVTEELKQATQDSKLDNATADAPYTVTSFITNPSFESGTAGWDCKGMKTQGNSYFSKKSGTYYAEAWVSAGSKLGNCSITQTLADLPAGRYRLKANALHIQQKSANSTTNAGDPQTGAYILAGNVRKAVTAMQEYTVEFVVLDNEATVGFVAEDATGNWVCVDNFRLYYLGRITAADQMEAIQTQVDNINSDIMPRHMQDEARKAMNEAIAFAQDVVRSQTADKVDRAIFLLDSCTTVCQASIVLYDNLKTRIDHAYKVLEWVKDNETKANKLQKAIEIAEGKWNDFTLNSTQLKGAVTTLNSAIKSADKGIYTGHTWMMGNMSDPNNDYYTGRTIESQNWVIFWQKGYGDEAPVNVKLGGHNVNVYDILEGAETAFKFYADSLKFIDRAKSKTSQYKMIIRLRYEEAADAWEATGSGVDNTIGLLTLTPWAADSRGGQTVYHEVGHCFQYQTHCDNGDWNGWMYSVGPNGTGFWEQCANWQAYKIIPWDQFTNDYVSSFFSQEQQHIMHEDGRYSNFFFLDHWAMLHGMEIVAKLWNQSRNPEDAVQAYQRITKTSNKVFNDQMWDCAARFATWDIPHLEGNHKDTWKNRPQPSFTKDDDGYWVISAANAPENTGHNIIKLNVPKSGTTVSAVFEGMAGDSRYRQNYVDKAGWRYGFVALKGDGTRVYGEMKSDDKGIATFEVPAGCTNLWLVVSGAAKTYVAHGWDDDKSNDEQWGYRVRFDSTNLQGKTNDHITAVEAVEGSVQHSGVFTLSGTRVSGNTRDLPAGIYIVNGRKVIVK